jgi:hypothetical protein
MHIAMTNPPRHVHIMDALGLPLYNDNTNSTTKAQTTFGLMLVENILLVW